MATWVTATSKKFLLSLEGPLCTVAGMRCLAGAGHRLATFDNIRCPCVQQCVDSVFREITSQVKIWLVVHTCNTQLLVHTCSCTTENVTIRHDKSSYAYVDKNTVYARTSRPESSPANVALALKIN